MGILRILLAVSVIIAHSEPIFGLSFVGSIVAVKTFYIISGFYMTFILQEKYIDTNNSYWLFISNRFLKIFPLYWIVLLLSIVLSFVALIITKGVISGRFAQYIEYYNILSIPSIIYLIFSNMFIFGQDIVMFLKLNLTSGNFNFTENYANSIPQLHKFLFVPQAWTIALELQFYLIAPFIVRQKPMWIFLIIGLSLLLNAYLSLYIGLNYDPWNNRFFPSEISFFLMGTVSYYIYKRISKYEIKKAYLNGTLIIVILSTIFYSNVNLDNKDFYFYFLSVLAIPVIFLATKYSKTDNFIGDFSYPLYIVHHLGVGVIYFFDIQIAGSKGIFIVIFSLLMSLFINRVIYKRIEQFRQNRFLARL